MKAEKRSSDKPVKQILLVHANLLNSHFLGDVIQMYKNNGYRFISLTEALANTAPLVKIKPEKELKESAALENW